MSNMLGRKGCKITFECLLAERPQIVIEFISPVLCFVDEMLDDEGVNSVVGEVSLD